MTPVAMTSCAVAKRASGGGFVFKNGMSNTGINPWYKPWLNELPVKLKNFDVKMKKSIFKNV